MISIQGLTERQRTIVELLWTCNTLDQVKTLIAALPSRRDQLDAAALIEIVTQESLEEEGELANYESAAEAAISSARSR
jgi:hypothetical protein